MSISNSAHHFARHDFAQRRNAVSRPQMTLAVGFRLNTRESLTDMMIISSPSIRAASFALGDILMLGLAHPIKSQTSASGRKVSS